MPQKLNKWQREVVRLEKLSDREISKELWEVYDGALKDVRKNLREYLKEYEDLPYYKQVQTGQLAELEKDIIGILNDSNPEVRKRATSRKGKALLEGYYQSMYQIDMQSMKLVNFLGLDTRFIRQAVHEPLAGSTLSSRLYKNRNSLAKKVQAKINYGMLQGHGYEKIAQAITRETEATYHKALRMTRTEAGRLRSLGKEEAYLEAKEAGVQFKKRWVSALDSRVRSSHQQLDGQVVEVDEEFTSPESGGKAKEPRLFGIAKEDINCRCTSIAEFEELAHSDRRDGNGEIIGYKNYQEWYNDRVESAEDTRIKEIKKKFSNTNMEEMVGTENYEAFLSSLDTLTNEQVIDIYNQYADQILYHKLDNRGAFATGRRVKLNQRSFDGASHKLPFQTVHHENGHALDNIGIEVLTGDSMVPVGTKKVKVGRKRVDVDVVIQHASALPEYELKETINREFWTFVNGDLPMRSDLGRRPRNAEKRAAWEEEVLRIHQESKRNFEEFKKRYLQIKDEEGAHVVSGLSDIIESTGHLGEHPLGSGHGSRYWKDPGKTEAEFFAHVFESRAVNPRSQELIEEVFPQSVGVYDKIISDILKGGM